MKRSIFSLVVLALCALSAHGQYLNTTRTFASTPSGTNAFCPTYYRTLTFDVEPINGLANNDLAIGESVLNGAGHPTYYGFQGYNNGSGVFPSQNGNFVNNFSHCQDADPIYNVVFGKLRITQPRRDLAVLRSSGTYIYYNTGTGIATSYNQQLTGSAIDASWGAFTSDDNSEDLALSDGSQIRIYQNLNNGNLNSTPYAFTISASKIILAQMDQNIYNPANPNNRWDLVTINSGTLSIRLNNNSNGFNAPQNIVFTTNGLINSIAVGDINNDGYNDIVIAGAAFPLLVNVYLNNGSGGFSSTPTWTNSAFVPGNPQVLIGDLGNPSDGTRNDGWNDLLITGYEAAVRIFINQKTGNFFEGVPQQSFFAGLPATATGKVMLADVQNTGGLSFIYAHHTSDGWVAINHHTGNPAPAPPKNAGWQPNGISPMITWSPNTERDLAGYYIYRKSFGLKTYTLVAQLGSSQTSWTDLNSSFCTSGCIGGNQYYVTAHDNASNFSDASNIVFVPQNGAQWKRTVDPNTLPGGFALHPAYPNPFNPSTQINFDLPEDGFVTLNVFDVLGRKVGEIANGNYAAGYHSATWNASGGNGSSVSSGVYFARFTATDEFGKLRFSRIGKLILAK